MTRLQKLIHDKMKEGKSLRRIAEESGVEYTSVNKYFNKGTEPRGKNLALLANYFNAHFADLLEDYIPTENLSPAKRKILEILSNATDEEVDAVLFLLEKRRKAD